MYYNAPVFQHSKRIENVFEDDFTMIFAIALSDLYIVFYYSCH